MVSEIEAGSAVCRVSSSTASFLPGMFMVSDEKVLFIQIIFPYIHREIER